MVVATLQVRPASERAQPPPIAAIRGVPALHEPQVRFVETRESVWPGLDHRANAHHLLGNIGDASSNGGCQDSHSQRGLGVFKKANGTIEDVGAKLTPVATTGCATDRQSV